MDQKSRLIDNFLHKLANEEDGYEKGEGFEDRGFVFHKLLTAIYAIRLLKATEKNPNLNFKISAEAKNAGKFDDLCITISEKGHERTYLIQFKNKKTDYDHNMLNEKDSKGCQTKRCITYDNMLTEKDFMLSMYHKSFEQIKEKDYKKVQNVILFTNIPLEKDFSENDMKKVNENSECFKLNIELPDDTFKGKEPSVYKFQKTCYEKLEKETTRNIAFDLVNKLGNTIDLRAGGAKNLLTQNQYILAKEVIDFKSKEFYGDFLEGTSKSKFRNVFIEEMRKRLNKDGKYKLSWSDGAQKLLKNTNFKNKLPGMHYNYELNKSKIRELVKMAKTGDEDTARILCQDVFENLNEKTFKTSFENNINQIYKGMDFSEIQKELLDDCLIKELKKFEPKWPSISEFLDRLLVIVDQPDNEVLETVLKQELQTLNVFKKRLDVSEIYTSCIYNWLKFKKAFYINKETMGKILSFCEYSWKTSQRFIDKQKYEIKNPAFKIKFKENSLKEAIVSELKSSKVLYIVASAGVKMSTMRAYRALEDVDINFIVVESAELKRFEVIEEIKIALESLMRGVLLIECESSLSDVDLNNILFSFQPFKIILILPKESTTSTNSISDSFDFKELEKSSIEFLLNRQIIFQSINEKVSMRELVQFQDAESFFNEHVINYMMLNNNIHLKYQADSKIEKTTFDNRKIYKNHLFLSENAFITNSEIVKVTNAEKFNLTKLDNDKKLILLLKDNTTKLICTKFKGDLSLVEPLIQSLEHEHLNSKECLKKTFILQNEAGVGKSTFLLCKKQELLESQHDHLVIHLNLKDHTKILGDFKTDCWKDVIIKEILKEDDILKSEYMKFCLNKSGKIIFLLDCFDEISDCCQKGTLSLLRQIQSRGGQIMIASRPNSCLSLENELKELSYSLSNFSFEEQKKYLFNLLKSSKKIECSQETSIMKELGKLIKYLKMDLCNEFFSNPLQLKMIFQIFKEDFVNGNFQELQVKLREKFHIYEMYEKFIDGKFVEHQKRGGLNLQISSQRIVAQAHKTFSMEQHKKLAGNLLLGFNALEDYSILTDTAIVAKSSDQYEFIHTTFAEYFAALVLVEKTDFDRIGNNKLVCLMFDYSFIYMRKFWDFLLSKEHNYQGNCYTRELIYNFEKFAEIIIEEKNFHLLNLILECSLLRFATRQQCLSIFNIIHVIKDPTVLNQFFTALQNAIARSELQHYCITFSFKCKLFDCISMYQHKLFHMSSFEKDKILIDFIVSFGGSEQLIEILFRRKWYDTLIQVLIRCNKIDTFMFIFKIYLSKNLSQTELQIIDENLHKNLVTAIECKNQAYLNEMVECFKAKLAVSLERNVLDKPESKGLTCFNCIFITSNEENMNFIINFVLENFKSRSYEAFLLIWINFEIIFKFIFKNASLFESFFEFLVQYEDQNFIKKLLSEEIVYKNTIKYGNDKTIKSFIDFMSDHYEEILQQHSTMNVLSDMNLKTFCYYFEVNFGEINGELNNNPNLNTSELKKILMHHIIMMVNQKDNNFEKFKAILSKCSTALDEFTQNFIPQIIQSNTNEKDKESCTTILIGFLEKCINPRTSLIVWDARMIVDCLLKIDKKGLKILENYLTTFQNTPEYDNFLTIFIKNIDEDYNYRTLFLYNRNNQNVHQVWLHYLLHQLLKRNMFEELLVALKHLENFRRYWKDFLKIKFIQTDGDNFSYFKLLSVFKFKVESVACFLKMLEYLIKYIEFIPAFLINPINVLIDEIVCNILKQTFKYEETSDVVKQLLTAFYEKDVKVNIFISSRYSKFDGMFKNLKKCKDVYINM